MAAQCNLIIDSCCDLPLSMLQIEGVDTLNFNYVMSDGDHEDDFYQSITPHEFYEKIRNGETPSTSQASPAAIEAAWRRAAESGIPTVYLCFSSGLSSNYSTAAALLAQVKEEFPDAPLYLVDLMIGSTPEGLLVLEALRQRDSGLSAEELVEWAEQARYFVQTAFMVDDLDALHRGGRIPASVAAAGSALNVKPLLTFDTSGHLALTGAARGRKKGLKQMADFFAKSMTRKVVRRSAHRQRRLPERRRSAARPFGQTRREHHRGTAQYWCHHRQPCWARHGVDFVLGWRPP